MNELKKCPICNSNENIRMFASANYNFSSIDDYAFASRKIPEYMHYTLMECTICKVLYAVDTLDQNELSLLYQKANFDSGREANYASETYIYYLKKYKIDLSGTIMDIGTGEGSFLRCLIKEGAVSVVGIEPSIAPIEAAQKDIKPFILNKIFIADEYQQESFKVITCFQTLEHIPNPENIISSINLLLENKGVFYTVCHDYTSFANKLLGQKSPIYDIEHLQIFSRKSMKKLLHSTGFSKIILFTIWNSYPINYWLKLLPIPIAIKKILLDVLDKILVGRIRIPLNVGNFGAIAWKE